MSYRCQVCLQAVPPGTPRKVHTVYRYRPDGVRVGPDGRTEEVTRREVAREFPVCGVCKRLLDRGVPEERVRRQYRRAAACASVPCLARNRAIPLPEEAAG